MSARVDGQCTRERRRFVDHCSRLASPWTKRKLLSEVLTPTMGALKAIMIRATIRAALWSFPAASAISRTKYTMHFKPARLVWLSSTIIVPLSFKSTRARQQSTGASSPLSAYIKKTKIICLTPMRRQLPNRVTSIGMKNGVIQFTTKMIVAFTRHVSSTIQQVSQHQFSQQK